MLNVRVEYANGSIVQVTGGNCLPATRHRARVFQPGGIVHVDYIEKSISGRTGKGQKEIAMALSDSGFEQKKFLVDLEIIEEHFMNAQYMNKRMEDGLEVMELLHEIGGSLEFL